MPKTDTGGSHSHQRRNLGVYTSLVYKSQKLKYGLTPLIVTSFKSKSNTLDYELGLPSDTPALLQRLGAGAAPTVHGTHGIDKTPVPQLGESKPAYTIRVLYS